MSRSFAVVRDYYDEGDAIFQKKNITIEPGLTVLVGCNGNGKTTFLQIARRQLEKAGIPVLTYNNLTDGGGNATSKAIGLMGDVRGAASRITSSEGENIILNIGDIGSMLGGTVDKMSLQPGGPKELWLLLDAMDSGLSIDNIRDIKQYLFDVALDDCKQKGIDLYIVAAANGYELVAGEQCLDVATSKTMVFKNYDEYASYVVRTRKRKDERYGKICKIQT